MSSLYDILFGSKRPGELDDVGTDSQASANGSGNGGSLYDALGLGKLFTGDGRYQFDQDGRGFGDGSGVVGVQPASGEIPDNELYKLAMGYFDPALNDAKLGLPDIARGYDSESPNTLSNRAAQISRGAERMNYPELNDEQKLFAATVNGEAAGSSEAAQRAVSHVIMNRFGINEWKEKPTVAGLLTRDQFSCIDDPKSQPFQEMKDYLNRRDFSNPNFEPNPRLERVIAAAMDVYHGKEPDFTNEAVLYWSPKAQEANGDPDPDWANSDKLLELTVPGTENEDFRWYKYKRNW